MNPESSGPPNSQGSAESADIVESADPIADRSDAKLSPFAAYLTGVASWFAGMGLQFVMIPTLAAVYLRATPQELAFAQISISIPQVILLLFTGRIADRVDARKMLIAVHAFAIIPPTMIFWLVWSDHLTYWNILVFGFSMGAIFAFSAPTRDALLPRVSSHDIQKAVTAAMLTQFAAQLIGFTLAGLAAPLAGPWTLPAMHAIVLTIGLVAAMRLPSYPPYSDADGPAPGGRWIDGLITAYRSPMLFPALMINIAVGVFFVGPFMVSIPLIVRDIFNGGQLEISLLNLSFWGGTILNTVTLMNRKPLKAWGMWMFVGTTCGAVALLLMSQSTYFPLTCFFATLWGIFAGFNMTISRTVVQVASPPRMRAQILALYNMCFIGLAPFGAFCVGMLSPLIGLRETPTLAAVLMIVASCVLALMTPLMRVRRPQDEN